MRTTPQQGISFHDPKCRTDNSTGSRCTSKCCSDCANPTCPIPRGVLGGRSNQVQFRIVAEQIVCAGCGAWHDRNGTWRSEAAVSESLAANALRVIQMNQQLGPQRLKHQMKELDPDYGPAKTGESAWYDLSCWVLLLQQKRSTTFDCVVFRRASSLRSC